MDGRSGKILGHKSENGGIVMEKLFYEERTGKYYRTLKAAKAVAKSAYVSRVWKEGDRLLGKELIFAYGEQLGAIKSADRNIERKLNSNGKSEAK